MHIFTTHRTLQKVLGGHLRGFQDEAADSDFPDQMHYLVHSLKKTLQSTILGSSSAPCTPTTVWKRCGTKMGGQHETYIELQPGGDGVAARMAAGQDPATSEFESLPPHFKVLCFVFVTHVL